MHEALLRLRGTYFATSLLIFLFLFVLTAFVDPTIFRTSVLPDTFATLAPFVLVALATTPSILSGGGGIDISIAPLMTLINVVIVTQLMPSDALSSPIVAFVVAVGLGAAVGAANGILVSRFRYQPILATLCAVFILGGLVLRLAPTPVAAEDTWPNQFANTIFGVPGGLILIAIPLLVWAALRRTAWMSNLYAVGGDDVAAFSSGVPVAEVRLLAYTLGGAIAGLGGVALTALLRAGDASIASQYILFALTAVALGGTSLAGGRGGFIGSALGASTIYLVQNLLSALGIPSSWLNVVYGSVLLFAILLAGGSRTKRKALA